MPAGMLGYIPHMGTVKAKLLAHIPISVPTRITDVLLRRLTHSFRKMSKRQIGTTKALHADQTRMMSARKTDDGGSPEADNSQTNHQSSEKLLLIARK
jgi:hypothetical protein